MPSGALRGIGVGIRNGISRRLLDGFVERRLFRPHVLSQVCYSGKESSS
jgi:hypothetical protein